MCDEHRRLGEDVPFRAASLRSSCIGAHDDVAENMGVKAGSFALAHSKLKDVCGSVDAPEYSVEFSDLIVVRYEDRQFALLQLKGCEHGARPAKHFCTRQPRVWSMFEPKRYRHVTSLVSTDQEIRQALLGRASLPRRPTSERTPTIGRSSRFQPWVSIFTKASVEGRYQCMVPVNGGVVNAARSET